MTQRDIDFIADGFKMQAQALKLFIGSVKQASDICAKLDDARAAHLAEISRDFASRLESELDKFNLNLTT
jgi:hypothetical protein